METERIRVWCEDLPFSELARPAVIRLLNEHRLSPLIATRSANLDAPLASAIGALTRGGVTVGLWPLLSEADGYWANACSANAMAALVETVVRFVRDNDLTVNTIAIDIEPPLTALRSVQRTRGIERVRALARALATPDRAQRLRQAVASFTRTQSYLQFHGFETLAAGIPLVILDHGLRIPLVQDALATPLLDVPWDRISWMTYTSMASGYFGPLVSRADARALMSLLLERALAFDRRHTAVSIGLTSTGQMKDEEIYRSPIDLALDVAAVRALGVDDISVYSLEGILARPEPERWFAALATPERRAPITVTARLMLDAAWVATRTASLLAPPI
ncbi:MAG: hypothetical protein HYY84_10145 [Deltaproteobacteria bacterium]|nr:hypothetical protein [Deltaproteobacteria bacterium]